MKYKDTFIPAFLGEEIVETLNMAYLLSVNERLFGNSQISHKELEERIIRVQQNLFKRIADY